MPTNNTESTMRIDYSDEWHQDFERSSTILKQAVSSSGIVKAKTVTFDVADTTGRAKTRQRDGELPYGRPDTNQVSKDLEEHFEPYIIDDWDVFRNNSQLRKLYMEKAMAVINRERDAQIIEELDTTTTELSASASDFTALATFQAATNALYVNDIPSDDGKLWGVVTPTAYNRMMTIDEFSSADYVDVKPFVEGAPAVGRAKHWNGVNWLRHTGLTGFGTALAQCYLFHSSAVGHKDDGEPTFKAGEDEKHNQHWCWARTRHCAKVILPRGVIRIHHNDTAAFA
ncbi:MAG: hypothetical protein GOVbin52_47 [Prokaryotic dsDNA virus sp.]|nr:MAG: hypothetical protein GOVbin52_47 [Prokaryotic dsDNA virus sp.]HBX94998.1 hypothetical protein [Hyphomonas sp.]|tara:strand:+ start:15543 stop:16397 length:855 start_codon:yes stop_codon:yes gene_type:complete